MSAYRKNDIVDDMFNRYLKSFNLTMDTIEKIGTSMYDFYLDYLHKSFKTDLKNVDYSDSQYSKFQAKKRKYDLKFEKLNFENIEYSEYKRLDFFERWRFRRRFKKYNKYIRKYINVLRNYFSFIPDDEYADEFNSCVLAEPRYRLTRKQIKLGKFRKLKNKFMLKIKRLNFVNLDRTDYRALTFSKRWNFRRRRRKYNRILRKYSKKLRKFYRYIPEKDYLTEKNTIKFALKLH